MKLTGGSKAIGDSFTLIYINIYIYREREIFFCVHFIHSRFVQHRSFHFMVVTAVPADTAAAVGDAPIYVINGEVSDLDTYEPEFFFPEETWLESAYTVELTVTDPNVTEIFYFCHIHNGMSGR